MEVSIERYGVGIDVSKKDFVVCIKSMRSNETESVKGRRKFVNTPKGFGEVKAWLKKQCKEKDAPIRILLEVTGVYHENLLYSLDEAGYYVSLELGQRVQHYLKSLGQDTKTDKEDAKGLASMALHRKLRQWKPVSDQLMAIRQLIRHRARLLSNKVAYENQLHAHQHSHLSDPEVSRSLKRHIKQLKDEIKKLEKSIRERIKADDDLYQRISRIVDSLPGVGWLSVAIVVAETDGFALVRSAKQLTKYAGYDIIERQSGTIKGKARISKRGNERLRTAMYMPALSIIRMKKTPLYQLYLRLLQRNGGLKKKAQVAVQRKLLCLIYSLWKSGMEYDPDYQPLMKAKKTSENQNESSPEASSELRGIEQLSAELPI